MPCPVFWFTPRHTGLRLVSVAGPPCRMHLMYPPHTMGEGCTKQRKVGNDGPGIWYDGASEPCRWCKRLPTRFFPPPPIRSELPSTYVTITKKTLALPLCAAA